MRTHTIVIQLANMNLRRAAHEPLSLDLSFAVSACLQPLPVYAVHEAEREQRKDEPEALDLLNLDHPVEHCKHRTYTAAAAVNDGDVPPLQRRGFRWCRCDSHYACRRRERDSLRGFDCVNVKTTKTDRGKGEAVLSALSARPRTRWQMTCDRISLLGVCWTSCASFARLAPSCGASRGCPARSKATRSMHSSITCCSRCVRSSSRAQPNPSGHSGS